MVSGDEVAKKDFDRNGIVKRILENEEARDCIISLLRNDHNIMVYYHCYYILQDATSIEPKKFMKYWSTFSELLKHKNSYHRDIATTLLANIISADVNNGFDEIISDYLRIAYDEKYMTGACCVRNLGKILCTRNDKTEYVFNFLIKHEEHSKYSEKQEELLKCEIVAIFDQIFERLSMENKERAAMFIRRCSKSISPKTRKISNEIMKKRKLITV